MPEKPAIILTSGGLDSTTCLAIAKHEGFDPIYSMTFDYGQRHRHELAAAERVARAFRVREHRVVRIDLRQFGHSALTDAIDVPKDRDESQMSTGVPITYVPARNTIFLSYALAWAEVLDVHDVFIGVNAVDYSGYPDCRPEFIEAFEKMARLGTTLKEFHIHAPLVHLTKADIIRRGVALGVDYGMTHSCYDPDEQGRACGHCDSCLLRKKGFVEADVKDPTIYTSPSNTKDDLIAIAREASLGYGFPSVGYDPVRGPETFDSIRALETDIRQNLLSEDLDNVRAALTSIIYWGNARSGYAEHRAMKLHSAASQEQLLQARNVFRSLNGPGLREIKSLELPQFSMISFASKIRMFLDPIRYAVLDNKILSLRAIQSGTLLDLFKQSAAEKGIRISKSNENAYEKWCQFCRDLAQHIWGSQGRAVDAERAIFGLIDRGRSDIAGRILLHFEPIARQ